MKERNNDRKTPTATVTAAGWGLRRSQKLDCFCNQTDSNTEDTQRVKSPEVSTEWLYVESKNPAFRRLMEQLLRGDE